VPPRRGRGAGRTIGRMARVPPVASVVVGLGIAFWIYGRWSDGRDQDARNEAAEVRAKAADPTSPTVRMDYSYALHKRLVGDFPNSSVTTAGPRGTSLVLDVGGCAENAEAAVTALLKVSASLDARTPAEVGFREVRCTWQGKTHLARPL
jgi:hypothetical protein